MGSDMRHKNARRVHLQTLKRRQGLLNFEVGFQAGLHWRFMTARTEVPRSLVVGDLPLTIHPDSSRPTYKPKCMVAARSPACMSPKSKSITRASPQCHDFRCKRDTAVVWTFAHLVHILVAAGIDSRAHLM